MENTTSTSTTCSCTPLSTESPQLGLQLSPLHNNNNNNNNNVVITVKEEEKEEEEEEYWYDLDGEDEVELEEQVRCSDVDSLVAKPCEKLHEMMPPPFLRKTYEMVENPETDDVLSWGLGGFSFVVWDPFKFSTSLLPKFFKHSNFSSFVRQLNTYGFRKVHFDQWEFANAGFQRDKKHLLKSIKRKRHGSANSNPRFKLQTETDVEKLKLDQEALKVEIDELKNQQLNSNQSLAAMEERIKRTEWKHKELLLFLAKAMKNTSLFQQLLQKYRQKKSLENERVSKRRRLASTLNDPNINCCHEGEFFGGVHESEVNTFLEFSPTIGLGTLSGLTSETETNSSDLSSGNYIMWEKLMEDDVICEDQEEVFDDSQMKFVHELEDLIGQPPASTVVGEVPCLGGAVGQCECDRSTVDERGFQR